MLRTTLLGKGVRALMQSPTGAQLVGIDTRRLHPLMFGVGLGLSGVAGCLLSMTYTISPSMGEPYTVTALIVITLGGFGSMAGSLVGGLGLGVIEAIGMHFTSPSLKSLLSYGIFIAVLLWRPNGLFARDECGATWPSWRARRRGAGRAVRRQRLRRLAGAHLPDVRRARVELEPLLRHHRATCRSPPRPSSASAPTSRALGLGALPWLVVDRPRRRRRRRSSRSSWARPCCTCAAPTSRCSPSA